MCSAIGGSPLLKRMLEKSSKKTAPASEVSTGGPAKDAVSAIEKKKPAPGVPTGTAPGLNVPGPKRMQ